MFDEGTTRIAHCVVDTCPMMRELNGDAKAHASKSTGIPRERMLVDPFGVVSARANLHPGYESPDAIGPIGPIGPDLSLLSVQTRDGKALAWHHVVLTRDGSKVPAYLDGRLEFEGEADWTGSDGAANVFPGGRCDGFANFEGKLDEASVYPSRPPAGC